MCFSSTEPLLLLYLSFLFIFWLECLVYCLVHPGICIDNWADRNKNGPLGGLVYFFVFCLFPLLFIYALQGHNVLELFFSPHLL